MSFASVRTALRQRGQFVGIWVVTAVMFAVSPLAAHGALGHDSIQAMLPFAGILAIAAIGQTLVVQQGGLDLSIPGTFSLGVVLAVSIPGGHGADLIWGLIVVALVGLVAGLVNGLAIAWIGITPLVATLGMNGVLIGVEQQITGGSINYAATNNWVSFTGSKFLGITTLAWIALVVVILGAIYMRRSGWGREFELVGANPRAARAAGLRVRRFQISSYMIAGLCYALAGALLAGYLGHPQIDAGNDYLLPSIAVVVLGGTALGGGRGSILATFGGVLFLSQLDQVLLDIGASQAIQDVIQGVIVALGMGLRTARVRGWRGLRLRPRERTGGVIRAVDDPVITSGASTARGA